MTVFSDDYQQSYKNFVQAIKDDPKDLQPIYDRLDELVRDYPQILELSTIDLFHDLYEVAPLAAVALFGHSGTRTHYVMNEEERKIFRDLEQRNYEISFSGCFSWFPKEIPSDFFKKLGVASQMAHFKRSSSFLEDLGEGNYKTLELANHYDEDEEEGWINVEHQGKKFIILKCDNTYGNTTVQIRPVYSRDGLEANKIGLGYIFDGFDINVQSHALNDILVYMETR